MTEFHNVQISLEEDGYLRKSLSLTSMDSQISLHERGKRSLLTSVFKHNDFQELNSLEKKMFNLHNLFRSE